MGGGKELKMNEVTLVSGLSGSLQPAQLDSFIHKLRSVILCSREKDL